MTDESHEPEENGPSSQPPGQQVSPPQRRVEKSTGIAWGVVVLFLGIALVVVFAVQNTDPVPITFLWMEGRFSLAIVVLVTVGAAILVTELVGISYRRRRRRRRSEREELRKLREGS